jgi:ANTAR domain
VPERPGSSGRGLGPSRRLLAALAELGGLPDGHTSARYRALCATAVDVLPVRGARLSLMTSDGITTLVAASDALSERIADLAFTTGEGPAADAFYNRAMVMEPDLEVSGASRWPVFRPAALELGVRSLFAFPLQVGAARLGVLCLDGDSTGMLSRSELTDALTLADAAMLVVLDHLGRAPPRDGWVTEVGGYLNVVHQATGMIMVQLGLTAENALLRLRAHAFSNSRTVVSVASDVVARILVFDNGE